MELLSNQTPGQLTRLERLYEEAFPACERKPFGAILAARERGQADILYLEDEGGFCGLAITMNGGSLVLLDYFAIDSGRRGGGTGSRALKELREYYRGKRLFLEIESVYEPADNLEQRKRRKQFYLKNGMTELGVYACVFGTNMELLGYGASVTFEEYYNLYREVYGPEKASHVVERH